MVHIVNLTAEGSDGASRRSITAEFEDQEWQDICDFVRYADEVGNLRAVREGRIHSRVLVHGEQGQPIEMTTVLPEVDDVAAFLHCLRPLILTCERTNFCNIRKILKRRISHEAVRAYLDGLLKDYDGRDFQGQVTIQTNDKTVNCEAALEHYLNAYEYHRDPKRKESIDELRAGFTDDASRALFLSMLIDRTNAIFAMASFIDVLQGKQRTFSTKARVAIPSIQ